MADIIFKAKLSWFY